MINFPDLPSDEECRKALEQFAGELTPVTVCECREMNYMHRLGCRCGGQVKWLYMDRSGAVLECGVDFSPIDNEPEGQDGSRYAGF